MSRTIARSLLLSVAAAVAIGWIGSHSLGQDAKAKKIHRLPPYYSGIVTEVQRLRIYALQDEYAEQIADLTSQLIALQEKRDAQIEALLTADQKERLKKAQENGAASRKSSAMLKKLESQRASAAAKNSKK